MFYLSLAWDEIEIAMGEKVLVLRSALIWRLAIVAEQGAPKAKPARAWTLGNISWTPLTQN